MPVRRRKVNERKIRPETANGSLYNILGRNERESISEVRSYFENTNSEQGLRPFISCTSWMRTRNARQLQCLSKKGLSEQRTMYVEWSANEKVAKDTTTATTLASKRTSVTMQGPGLNVASDTLMTTVDLLTRHSIHAMNFSSFNCLIVMTPE